jgi:methyl coenzyme M reductase alpha subunit
LVSNDNDQPGPAEDCPICSAKHDIGQMLREQVVETLRSLTRDCSADIAAGTQSEAENTDDKITIVAASEMLASMGAAPAQTPGGTKH